MKQDARFVDRHPHGPRFPTAYGSTAPSGRLTLPATTSLRMSARSTKTPGGPILGGDSTTTSTGRAGAKAGAIGRCPSAG